jgi:hypothetical protein
MTASPGDGVADPAGKERGRSRGEEGREEVHGEEATHDVTPECMKAKELKSRSRREAVLSTMTTRTTSTKAEPEEDSIPEVDGSRRPNPKFPATTT